MIELKQDRLHFHFPEVHTKASFSIDFQRTLRIPDDGKTYPLPPGMGRFPLRHVDDYAETVGSHWLKHGGVMLPMYQSEAVWLNFSGGGYPFALKVATGKINAVTGENWANGLHRDPQDYLVIPKQRWLDGYCVERGLIRQFVAMPLGAGYTAEEQITNKAEVGGIQLIAYPMKREVYERRFGTRQHKVGRAQMDYMMAPPAPMMESADMGLAPGGKMQQDIYDDTFDFSDWDLRHKSRCFVHLCNSMAWRAVTHEEPPTAPFTAAHYSKHGLPWFTYYADGETAVSGASTLAQLKSVKEMGESKGDVPLPENQTAHPQKIIKLRAGLKKNQVRESDF